MLLGYAKCSEPHVSYYKDNNPIGLLMTSFNFNYFQQKPYLHIVMLEVRLQHKSLSETET